MGIKVNKVGTLGRQRVWKCGKVRTDPYLWVRLSCVEPVERPAVTVKLYIDYGLLGTFFSNPTE